MDVHPNVVRAHLFSLIEGRASIVLELVPGGNLQNWLETSPRRLDPPCLIKLAIQFCDGMTHAASRGLSVPRDIKPANCLISEDGVLKVTDFGIAKLATSVFTTPDPSATIGDPRTESSPGQRQFDVTAAGLGTIPYMAP